MLEPSENSVTAGREPTAKPGVRTIKGNGQGLTPSENSRAKPQKRKKWVTKRENKTLKREKKRVLSSAAKVPAVERERFFPPKAKIRKKGSAERSGFG